MKRTITSPGFPGEVISLRGSEERTLSSRSQ
jgi:hypothetical protein